MITNENYIYSVDDIEFKSSNLLQTVKQAKEKAIAEKQKAKIRLNGNLYALICRRGILVSA